MALLSGRVTAATRRELLPAIERGEINLVVGTQALVQEHVKFKSLALVVIDEQHRFGVVQRGTLAAKGENPDVLVMTATPIPRTLALTECGDMEVSVIRGLPPGRQPVKTIVKADSRRDEAYAMMRDEIRARPPGLRRSIRWSKSPRRSISRPPRRWRGDRAQCSLSSTSRCCTGA